MRLHRHDELVEAMARELCSQNDIDPDALEPGNCPYNDDEEVVDKIVRREPHFYKWRLFRNKAVAALDALLEAAVRLEVGEVGIPDTVTWFAKTAEPALILRLEASDDRS